MFQLYGYNFGRLIGDFGDARFIISIVEYNYQWLTGHYENYWDGFFFYPDKEVISYSDNLLGITPLYFLIRIFSSDCLGAFQWLIVACQVLNFLSAYECLSKLSGNRTAAAAGAFIFTFSLAMNGIHNHPQFIFRFCVPWFFYYLYRYLKDPEYRLLLVAVGFLILQFYLGAYLGVFLSLGGLFFGFSFLAVNYKDLGRYKKSWMHLLFAVLLLGTALAPMLYYYAHRILLTGYYSSYDYYMQTVPRLSSWFHAFPGALCWKFLVTTKVDSEYPWLHFLFPGAVVIASVISAFYFAFKKKNMYLVLLICLIVFLCFTTWYNGHTLYGFLMKIPGVKTARVVSRYVTILLFFAAWLFTLQAAVLLQKFKKTQLIFSLLTPVILIADNYCSPNEFKTFSKTECRQRIEQLAAKVKSHPLAKTAPAFAYVPGIKENSSFYHIDAMLCALQLKTKTVNGYSSSCHKDYGPFWTNIDSVSLARWCTATNTSIKSLIIVK